MNSAASVKARLMNIRRKTGRTMDSLLVTYGIERTVYRISVSRYVNNFTLKGGVFLYAMFHGGYSRATIDLDFLLEKLSNDEENMRRLFTEIFSIESDDPLSYDLSSLKVSPITVLNEYHGVNISVFAYLERTRIPISIDVGVGDVVSPCKVKMEFPVVLGETRPIIYAYSLDSCVAEKFEAVVSLGYDNSRFKDFYDLFVLAHSFDFDGEELKGAIQKTFRNRGTDMKDIVAFEDEYSDDSLRITRWNAFIKKKKAMINASLKETISTIRKFVGPVIESIENETHWSKHWSHEDEIWD